MNRKEFYDYIQEKFTIDGVSSRLIDNILGYAELQGWEDKKDLHNYLSYMFDGTIGLSKKEIKKVSF